MSVTLDPNDPFDAALIPIVETNRSKRADYTAGTWDDNFRRAGEQLWMSREAAVELHIATKQARLHALSAKDGEPQNESIKDTLLDRAVYSIIAYAMALENEKPF